MPYVNEFLNTIYSNFLQPCITEPTRAPGKNRRTLINNIFVDIYDKQLFAGNFLEKLSDHLPNFLIINGIENSLKKIKIVVRDFKKLNKHHYLQDITELNNIDFLQCKDAIQMYSVSQDHQVEIINNNAPLKALSIKEKKRRLKPWITPFILISIKTKNIYYKKFIKTKTKF